MLNKKFIALGLYQIINLALNLIIARYFGLAYSGSILFFLNSAAVFAIFLHLRLEINIYSTPNIETSQLPSKIINILSWISLPVSLIFYIIFANFHQHHTLSFALIPLSMAIHELVSAFLLVKSKNIQFVILRSLLPLSFIILALKDFNSVKTISYSFLIILPVSAILFIANTDRRELFNNFFFIGPKSLLSLLQERISLVIATFLAILLMYEYTYFLSYFYDAKVVGYWLNLQKVFITPLIFLVGILLPSDLINSPNNKSLFTKNYLESWKKLAIFFSLILSITALYGTHIFNAIFQEPIDSLFLILGVTISFLHLFIGTSAIAFHILNLDRQYLKFIFVTAIILFIILSQEYILNLNLNLILFLSGLCMLLLSLLLFKEIRSYVR